MKIKFFSFIFIFSIIFSKSDNELSLTNTKWISEGSPKNEVWFQDWSGYVRLFITTFTDTLLVDPGPYITETKNKPYLTPKPYSLINKSQLIGNIVWTQDFLWNGEKNVFLWEVDRANPKIKLPIKYEGSVSYKNGKLFLEINQEDQSVFSMILNPVSYY